MDHMVVAEADPSTFHNHIIHEHLEGGQLPSAELQDGTNLGHWGGGGPVDERDPIQPRSRQKGKTGVRVHVDDGPPSTPLTPLDGDVDTDGIQERVKHKASWRVGEAYDGLRQNHSPQQGVEHIPRLDAEIDDFLGKDPEKVSHPLHNRQLEARRDKHDVHNAVCDGPQRRVALEFAGHVWQSHVFHAIDSRKQRILHPVQGLLDPANTIPPGRDHVL